MKIDGIQFTNKKEYEAALRDQQKIKKIRREYDFTDQASLKELLKKIDHNEYTFETIIGRRFDDEVFELSNTMAIDDNLAMLEDPTVEAKALDLVKKMETRRKWIVLCSGFIALASLGYVFYYDYAQGMQEQRTSNLVDLKDKAPVNLEYKPNLIVDQDGKEVELELLPEYAELYQLNKKLIGWVKIDDTVIDYPVMQTVNNEYYLSYGFDQEKDSNGSIFLDYRCDIVNGNTNYILYGHNMISGKMFGSLKKYANESYYRDHGKITFDTIYEKGTYEVAYVFESQVYNEEDIIFKYYEFIDAISKKEFQSNIAEMEALSLYDTGVEVSYGDELLTLSTCEGTQQNKRFVVVAKRVK